MRTLWLTCGSLVVRLSWTLVLNCEQVLEPSLLAFPFTFSLRLQRYHVSRTACAPAVLAGGACVVTVRRWAAGVSSAYGTRPSDIMRTMPRRTASSEDATTKVSFST